MASLRLIAIGLGVCMLFVLAFDLIYHTTPTFYGFLAYVFDPPGPLPINKRGAIWYVTIVMAVGVSTSISLWRSSGDTQAFRRGFLLQLMAFAVFSYFLGRSHDNNILNLMPFYMLVILHAISATPDSGARTVAIVLASVQLGWLPLFGWQVWKHNVNKLLTFTPRAVVEKFSLSWHSEEADRFIAALQSEAGEPVTMLFNDFCLLRHKSSEVWNAMNSLENYYFMPSKRRREFLARSAAFLRRSGWLVVDRRYADSDAWLADFDSVYSRVDRRETANYYAIRYMPKETSELR